MLHAATILPRRKFRFTKAALPLLFAGIAAAVAAILVVASVLDIGSTGPAIYSSAIAATAAVPSTGDPSVPEAGKVFVGPERSPEEFAPTF